ncbi:MAG: hypothetical protein A2X36_09860 [Elusimicrobia bacterium GWA2_69_24]|nr:MAG: hypothetical protein A2X36_09860 [Elusimicrobia bacterium GWA2_69_24]HBL18924.1 hypothetical protein [Elusimicrobiota bacterium]
MGTRHPLRTLGLAAAGFVLCGISSRAQSVVDFDRVGVSIGDVLRGVRTEVAGAGDSTQADSGSLGPAQEIIQVRGENNGGFPVVLTVEGSRVHGKTDGGYPVALALSREGGGCRITGKMLGGYPVDVTLSAGRVSGRTMGGYPVELKLEAGGISGVAKAYDVTLSRQGSTAEGAGVGRFPVRLSFSAPVDDCQFVAVAIAALHRH